MKTIINLLFSNLDEVQTVYRITIAHILSIFGQGSFIHEPVTQSRALVMYEIKMFASFIMYIIHDHEPWILMILMVICDSYMNLLHVVAHDQSLQCYYDLNVLCLVQPCPGTANVVIWEYLSHTLRLHVFNIFKWITHTMSTENEENGRVF